VVRVEQSDQIALTFFKPQGKQLEAAGSLAEDWYWADHSHTLQTSFATDGVDASVGRLRPPLRQAGQLVLRPDGGFFEPGGNSRNGVQQLTHGTVALGGGDLVSFDKLEERLAKCSVHQHLGGAKPYHHETTVRARPGRLSALSVP
jgi:hypothetical protein